MSREVRDVADAVLGPGFAADVDPVALWRSVVDLGWHRIGVDEAAGGVGGDLADLVEIAVAVGRHAAPIPVVETALAAWVLAAAGVGPEVLGDDPAVVSADPSARDVRLLPVAAHAVLVDVTGTVWVSPVRTVETRRNLADEAVAHWPAGTGGKAVGTGPDGLAEAVVARAALLQAAMLLGCVERATQLVGAHVTLREQFGRPLLAQQAVAHGLATTVAERDLLAAAVRAATATPTAGRCVAARATAARSAGDVARTAHQLMGAMGITREHPLQLVTRRIWAWRDTGGTQRRWEHDLGARTLTGTLDDALWHLATGPAPGS